MAPHSSGVWSRPQGPDMQARSFVNNGSAVALEISASEGNILQCLAVAFSSLSVASSFLAFYWFLKMRRSFRHDLIMLLIQSDMFKALWFMLYPIVVFTYGPVHNDSVFCQVNGFFLAVGVESSDIAVLVIALHSALTIFRPKASGGEGGLYPYRRYAYAVWLLFPVLMAGLAFLNSGEAYVTEGTYCYLPVRPFWYRLVLAWIPRYLIFLVILVIYVSIYLYVKNRQDGFNKIGRRFPLTGMVPAQRHQRLARRNTVPSMPVLACHGLVADSRDASSDGGDTETPQPDTKVYIAGQSNSNVGVHRFMFASIVAAKNDTTTLSSAPSSNDSDSFTGPKIPQPLPRIVMSDIPCLHVAAESEYPLDSRVTSWKDTFVRRVSAPTSGPTSRSRSVVDIFTILRHHPNASSTLSPTSQLHMINSRGQTFVDAEMFRTRDKIQRQLRFLFIYPLVYIGMWIIPFASHVLQYDDHFALNPPFPLTCITTVSICMQASIDCLLFSTREKPWKHIPGTRGGFGESLRFWTGWTGHGARRIVAGPGKTREEMVREARMAYRRRDEEAAQRRMETGLAGGKWKWADAGRGAERSWWEFEGHESSANMTPLTAAFPASKMGVESVENVEDVASDPDPVSAWSER